MPKLGSDQGIMAANNSPTPDELKSRLGLILNRIISCDQEPDKSLLNNLHHNGTIDSVMFDRIINIINHAKYLHKSFRYIRFETKEQANFITKFIANEDLEGVFKKPFSFKSNFPYGMYLDLFLLITPLESIVVEKSAIDPKMESALRGFVDTAEIILKCSYEGSNASKVEQILLGNEVVLKELVDGLNSERVTYDFSKSFIALAAPSLEGKTQFAFLLRHVRPLYFALGAAESITLSNITQPIYLNFAKLNKAIKKCADEDLTTIRNNSRTDLEQSIIKVCQTEAHKIEADKLCRVTTDELKVFQSNTKLFTLGLLMYLVKDANQNYNPNTCPAWMEYHAKRETFEFRHVSIDEIPPRFFEGYCLYLDEFTSESWAVYVRNLARAIGLKCAVANTNTNITNLVGKNESNLSGSEGQYIWSIVVTELKMGNFQTLQVLTGVEESISWICEHAISDKLSDDPKLCRQFLTDFKDNQVQNLRPGIALAAAKAINMFKQERQNLKDKVTFEFFFRYLISAVSKTLNDRKPRISTEISALSASFNLILSAAYDRYKKLTSLSNLVNFLEYHFYYLINPSNPQKWLFLTLAPGDTKSLPVTLRYHNENLKGPAPWNAELTFFKAGELLTILACLNLFSTTETLSNSLTKSYINSGTLNFDTGNTSNPEAEKRDGNRLEVMSTLCCSHSSHHAPTQTINSYDGQSGTDFFKNLFIDLYNGFINDRSDFVVDFLFEPALIPTFSVEDFLKNMKIPYLWVSNMKLPEIFEKMMNESSAENRSFNMERINRTTDQSKIDLEFRFYCNVVDHEKSTPYRRLMTCNVECKNWSDNLLYKDLTEIITRAQDAKLTLKTSQGPPTIDSRATLNIIICNKLGNAFDDTKENFDDYCISNKVDAYRFKFVPDPNDADYKKRTFHVEKINNALSPSPLTIAFVIELAVINSV